MGQVVTLVTSDRSGIAQGRSDRPASAAVCLKAGIGNLADRRIGCFGDGFLVLIIPHIGHRDTAMWRHLLGITRAELIERFIEIAAVFSDRMTGYGSGG